MGDFFMTIINVLLPIFIQVTLGFILKKLTGFQVAPLVKIQFYLIIPALLFVTMYEMPISGSLFGLIILHTLLLIFVLFLLSLGLSRLLGYSKSMSSAMINCVCLYNSGNFGIPLVSILFSSNPLALSVQMIIVMITNIMTNTLGIFNANRGKKGLLKALLAVVKVPMLFSIIVAFILKGLSIPVWTPVWLALDSLGKAMVPIALITLGAQLAQTSLSFKWLKVLPTLVLRLLASPVIALALTYLLGLDGLVARVLIIASAAPVAVNAVLIAIQYKNEPEFSSEAVFLSTILSSVTVATIIQLTGLLPL